MYVDEEGFSVIDFPARGLRITPAGRATFTPRVLAALLAAAAPATRAPSAVRATRLEEYQIPQLEPADVERFDALLADADTRRRLAQREIDMLDELCRTTVGGLTDGTLTLTTPTSPTTPTPTTTTLPLPLPTTLPLPLPDTSPTTPPARGA